MNCLSSATPTKVSQTADPTNVVPETPLPEDPIFPKMLPDDKLGKVLEANDKSRISMEIKIGSLVEELGFLRDDNGKFMVRVIEGKKALAPLQPQVVTNQTAIQDLQDQVWVLEESREVAEGHSYRSNLSILGLQEGIEGCDPLTTIENCFKTFVPACNPTPFLLLERTYRVLGCPPVTGALQCSMQAKLFHFRPRDSILNVTRLTWPLKLENQTGMLFLDYTQTDRANEPPSWEKRRAFKN
ncbi:hypothetical protein NDU88_003207 [Pleurodeles waltl]|uniref:Uncharacterized protein n=1 Tax=Pleurodeles waltl TaxID=8319 RepID=A0AAV7UZH5_PLEWA|nr:hypothetical protein NDU88_003207 [Pleurodeles waltl]